MTAPDAPTGAPAEAPSLLSLELSAAERSEIQRRLLLDVAGASLLGVGALHGWLRPADLPLSAAIQGAAALLVGLPVMLRGLRGLLSAGGLQFTDQLVALAVLAALCDGQFATAALVPLVLDLGRLFEERSALGVRAAIAGLRRLSARSARRVEGEAEQAVDPEALRVGDRVRVRPGEVIPADGQVRAGASAVDQAAVTGEARPEEIGVGDDVFAGSLNLSALLEVEVRRVGGDSVLGRVGALLSGLEAARPPALRLLDRHAQSLLPLILVTATAVLALSQDLSRAIAVLVAAAPTGLVIAGPATFIAALTAASRRDVLIKGAVFLEGLPALDTVVFDKTGTLTTGQLEVLAAQPEPGQDEATLLSAAATCGFGSLHPASRAVVAEAERRGLARWAAEGHHEVAGLGAAAATAGGALRLGRRSWAAPNAAPGAAAEPRRSAVSVGLNGALLGEIALGDQLRPGAAEAIIALRALGLRRVILLTGDSRAEAARVAERLAEAGAPIDQVEAEVLPEGKLRFVQALEASGARVLMVGDGINDALALSAASVGVAFGARRNEVVLGGADIAVLTEALDRLPELLRLGRALYAVLYQNIALAVILSVSLVAAAAAGALPPLAAAALQHLGALLVIANAARLLHRPPEAPAEAALWEGWADDPNDPPPPSPSPPEAPPLTP